MGLELFARSIGKQAWKKRTNKRKSAHVTAIYQEFETWSVNMGDKTIHAKRMPGFYRSLKYLYRRNLAGLFCWPLFSLERQVRQCCLTSLIVSFTFSV